MSTPEQTRRLIETAVTGAIDSLQRVDASTPSAAIAHLQEASRNTEIALNEALAAGVVGDGLSMRQAAAAGGLAPNTLPARLAGTSLLGGYQGADRRVRAEGIARARYDIGRQPSERPAAEKETTEEDTVDISRPATGPSAQGPAAHTDPSDSVDR
ncbi:hypothetical protein [Microlunatus soli]|uniref:Uncharacterized protein n=1 Tax=Microlunatus soli TaxID=630515 RepID=A0A1H1QVH8_9ACTN|nr:hypothetical protein [Microlunatus soli]SDS26869.1 hypothetical protein SAMN04489812_1389 [Microlunatus soli]